MRRPIGALAGAALIAIMASGLAFANHAIPGDDVAPNANSHIRVDGNPRCGATPAGGFSMRIDASDLAVGTYGPIRITYYNGKYVSWEIRSSYRDDYDADTVIVKGGPMAIIYSFTDPGDDSDTRLTAPRNYNGAQPKYYGISHVDFCFDAKG